MVHSRLSEHPSDASEDSSRACWWKILHELLQTDENRLIAATDESDIIVNSLLTKTYHSKLEIDVFRVVGLTQPI